MPHQFSLEDTLVVGLKNVTEDVSKYLYQLPTLSVNGVFPPSQVPPLLDLTGYQVLNVTGGLGQATLKSSSLVNSAFYVFVNSSGVSAGVVNLRLDSGTIGGLAVFPLVLGTPVKFRFDGVNLV